MATKTAVSQQPFEDSKLMRARCRLMTKEPWYGHIAMNMTWIKSEMSWMPVSSRTMGVRIVNGGDIQCLYYEPFVESLSIKELFAVIQHEIEHIVRCHCLRISARNPKGWNIACVKPDELITGVNMPISDIGKGMSVHDSTGGVSTVKGTMRRKHSGTMMRLRGRYLMPIEITPKHPILVSKWTLKTGLRNGIKTTYKEFSEPDFIEAGELSGCRVSGKTVARSGFSLVLPKYDLANIKEFHQETGLFLWGEHHSPLRPGDGSIKAESLRLDEDTLWMFGVYVAEGSATSTTSGDSGGIQFSLSSEETETANRLVDILGSYGFTPRIDVTESTIVVKCMSPILGRAFHNWFGRGPGNKQCPDWLLTCPVESLVASFFDGYFTGDGCYSPRRSVAFSKSTLLAQQLQRLGFTWNVPIGLCLKNRPSRDINGNTLPAQQGWEICVGTHHSIKWFPTLETSRERSFHHDAGHSVYLPLLDVDKFDYNGDVCNIETGDHTYLVSNVVVHNCDMTVNGTKRSPRIGYKEPSNNKIIVPMEHNIVWIPEDWPTDETAEVYYDKLEKMQKRIGKCCQKCGRSMQGQDERQNEQEQENNDDDGRCSECGQSGEYYNYGGVSGRAIDNHDVWNQTDVSHDEARQIIKDTVAQATEKCQGYIPSHLSSVIEALNRPIVKWRELLKHYLGRHVGNRRLTHSRRNRRFGSFGMPGISRHAAATVNIIVDTSGSISPTEMEQFFTEIESVCSTAKVNLLQWDADFQGYARYRRGDWKRIDVKGRGGTDMAEPVNWLVNNQLVADCQIMLTDGICNWSEPYNFPMITVITTPEATAPDWGHVVRLKSAE